MHINRLPQVAGGLQMRRMADPELAFSRLMVKLVISPSKVFDSLKEEAVHVNLEQVQYGTSRFVGLQWCLVTPPRNEMLSAGD